MPSETILGIESFWFICLAAAGYFFVGIWLFWDWVTHDETPKRPWQWGDPPRHAKPPLLDRIIMQAGPAGLALAGVTFALRGLGVI